MTWPVTDAIALGSPSGRISKRALRAAQERIRKQLFGDGLMTERKTEMGLIERRTGTAYRRLPRLTSDDIVNRASDVHAVTCRVCKGEGFLNTEHLCPQCFGSGAVLVPQQEMTVPRVAHGHDLLRWSLFFLTVAVVIVAWWLE